MRLASKIFLGFSLVIVVLGGVGFLSLRAVGRLVSLNREVASETLPALRLSAAVRDSMLALARLEARFTILRDARFASVWRERADAVRDDLARLRDLLRTDEEARHLGEAQANFERYRQAVQEEHERLIVSGAGAAVAAPPGRALAEQVESSLEALQGATYARVSRAQGEVARLEART